MCELNYTAINAVGKQRMLNIQQVSVEGEWVNYLDGYDTYREALEECDRLNRTAQFAKGEATLRLLTKKDGQEWKDRGVAYRALNPLTAFGDDYALEGYESWKITDECWLKEDYRNFNDEDYEVFITATDNIETAMKALKDDEELLYLNPHIGSYTEVFKKDCAHFYCDCTAYQIVVVLPKGWDEIEEEE